MNLMLQSTMPDINFDHPSACLSFIKQTGVTDLEGACAAFTFLLEGIATVSRDLRGHQAVLEDLRSPLDYVLGEVNKRYASRPLPPSSKEEDTLQQVVHLWKLMSLNYGRILQSTGQAGGPGAEERPLLAQRRLRYHSLAMVEYFRARREMPAGMWRELHSLFHASARSGWSATRVPDALNETWGAQSALECYVAMLLIDAAGPCSRTPREFAWLVRWALRFAPYCNLRDGLPQGNGSMYALEPDADNGLRPAMSIPPGARVFNLDTVKLASHIQAVVGQLKSGVSAASLGLGDDCVQPACARLLVSLYRPWGLASSGRKFPRRALHGQVRICADLAGVAFFLTGKEFEQPNEADVLLRYNDFTRTEAMLAFGESADDNELTEERIEDKARHLGFVQEVWDVLDQSVAGYRLVRQVGDSRIEHRQMLGVKTSGPERMLLAEISWLQYQQNGALCAGISLLPGPPAVMPVRLMVPDHQVRNERFRLGFLIPGVPALKTEPSLVVPAGWFLSDRRIEIHDEFPWVARMSKLVARGANFDRVNFVREELIPAFREALR